MKARVRLVLAMVGRQLEVLRVKKEISSMVQEEMGKSQREYILRQQMKAIKEELGEGGDDDEIEELRERIRRAKLSADAEKIAQEAALAPALDAAAVGRVQRHQDVPRVARRSAVVQDHRPTSSSVADVRRCLDEDHFGLEKVKKRIVEYIAVRKLRNDKKGPILCFIGPPGVGKTSLGRSIARSMGRRYDRIALGGVRDEAEIRGHRRTYVGALPGRIIQALKKVGHQEPGAGARRGRQDGRRHARRSGGGAARGARSRAERHLPGSLHRSARSTSRRSRSSPPPTTATPSPAALCDRMEVIEVRGYTRNEKLSIAREFLVPKQLSTHGLTDERLEFTERRASRRSSITTPREAGVRSLEREIASMCRHVAVRLAEGEDVHEMVIARARREGPRRRTSTTPKSPSASGEPGVATGLAWTPARRRRSSSSRPSKMPGKGNTTLTGNMRNVMQESATTAVSFVRRSADRLMLAARSG